MMLQIPIVDSRKKKNQGIPTTRWIDQDNELTTASKVTENVALNSLMNRLSGVPKRTAVMGQSVDGMPILFSLTDPRPGSLLIPADRGGGKTELLMAIAASLARLNRPEDVRFAVISENPAEWEAIERRYPSHFMKIVPNNKGAAEELIYHLCDLLEGRQNGGRIGTAYVLLYDGMETITRMSSDVQANFEWLVRLGSRFQIWTAATLDSGKFLALHRFANLFRTHVVGSIHDTSVAARLLPPRFHDHTNWNTDKRFTVRIHQNWLQFFIPTVDV